MGLIICDKHGGRGIAFACLHIEILAEKQQKAETFLCLSVDIGDTGLATKYVFCDNCRRQYKLPATEEVLPDSALDTYTKAFSETQPFCGECLRDLMGCSAEAH